MPTATIERPNAEIFSPERTTANFADVNLTTKPDIFVKREENFVLWRATTSSAPKLVIGKLQPGAPLAFIEEHTIPLEQQLPDFPDLWLIPANKCNLTDGQVYHYWFEVKGSYPDQTIRITDPMAYTVDWRLLAPRPEGSKYDKDLNGYPAAVMAYRQGKLVPCDLGGEFSELQNEPLLSTLPANNRLVIYEMPITWARKTPTVEFGIGTFRDIAALVDHSEGGANFSDLEVTQKGNKYLVNLGVNAIELLPPADSTYYRQWGYGPTNSFAPDFELGFPEDYSWPTPNRDLRNLSVTCHKFGIRLFMDVVMGFAKNSPYLAIASNDPAINDFFILDIEKRKNNKPDDPDLYTSRIGEQDPYRKNWGGKLFRYDGDQVLGYDLISGKQQNIYPARQLMIASLLRWMNDFHMDGIRIDSVENVSNWDFIQEYKDLARETWKQRFIVQGGSNGADERFLVVGEELWEPKELLTQKRLDGLWHKSFMDHIRTALLGQNVYGKNFEWTVHDAIDCRNMGYSDGSQAIIYLTSHDVEGFRNERLYNFFQNNHVWDTAKRIKLGFACLLTAVGVPMILAGEEFADQHDLLNFEGRAKEESGKQTDPVNYEHLDEENNEWRRDLKDYVARLIKLRTTYDALAINDTEFIHVDFNDGKRVLVWQRGQPNTDNLAVVVANFSDFCTADPFNSSSEYRVNNWPATPPGKRWFEVTQNRSADSAGREPIFPWEAKVYVLINAQ
jgi:pullulanase